MKKEEFNKPKAELVDKNGHNSNTKSQNALKEEEILSFWKENKVFEKSLGKDITKDSDKENSTFVHSELKGAKKDWTFYDGPPFATGMPHYGHLLASVIKDVIPRYKTMQGNIVPRKWGWDCHGLPVENLIEKELDLKNKKEIIEYGIEKFNLAARQSVLKYADEWRKLIPRIGRWVDMENDYKTMESWYTESVWWAFKSLWNKDFIYEGFKSMHVCPRCETTLSNFEVNQGYKDISDISVYVKFKILKSSSPDEYLLAWTTTPWTLPGNVALAVNPEVDYIKVEIKNNSKDQDSKSNKKDVLIFAKEIMLAVMNSLKIEESDLKILDTFKGSKLVGLSYEPLFDYYKEGQNLSKNQKDKIKNAWKVYPADFVTTADGTGVVHIASAFGDDDYKLSLKENLPLIHHVSLNGKFKPEVTDFADLSVKPKDDAEKNIKHEDTDILIIKYLALHNKLVAKEKIVHSYPHCWRCETPLINYATTSWFMKINKDGFKEKLLSENEKINWVPKEVGEGRFAEGIKSAPDWAISRSRFWGAPIPVWKCNKCEKNEVIGSIKELSDKISESKLPKRDGEVDLHRPYIDESKWKCSCGGEFERIPEVFDCWFESGSVPYASNHYIGDDLDSFKPSKKIGFPAEFIGEGLDQTRGWFYTMHVLGTALFGVSPFKNAIVNGLILAEDGQKMSKSKKNFPDPIEVINKYGADAMRLYMLSSSVVESEEFSFSEKGVDEVSKKFIARLNNVVSFLNMYKKDGEEFDVSDKSKNILDKWIILDLRNLWNESTYYLDNYQLNKAVRPAFSFLDDLSNWYLRRSRERFKSEETLAQREDRKMAFETLGYVLLEFSKIIAPFAPFMAESIYSQIKSRSVKKVLSVHLDEWPSMRVPTKKEIPLLEEMVSLRGVAEKIHALRQSAKINVRQPLALTTINQKFDKELITVLADEVNVKKIKYDGKIDNIILDTNLTEDLTKEGILREFVRAIQEERKKAGLQPRETVILEVECQTELTEIIKEFEDEIFRLTNTKEIRFLKNSGNQIKVADFSAKISFVS